MRGPRENAVQFVEEKLCLKVRGGREEGRKAVGINHTGASRDECQGEACMLEVYCSDGEDGQHILTARKRRVWRIRQLCLQKTLPSLRN